MKLETLKKAHDRAVKYLGDTAEYRVTYGVYDESSDEGGLYWMSCNGVLTEFKTDWDHNRLYQKFKCLMMGL